MSNRQLNLPNIEEPGPAERAFLVLARRWHDEFTLVDENHAPPRQVDEIALACVLLAVQCGQGFTKVGLDQCVLNRQLASKRPASWFECLPWELCQASRIANRLDLLPTDHLAANLDHHNSWIRGWCMEIAWMCRSWLDKDMCIQLLLKNYRSLDPSTIIVPAVPFHLAYEWLTRYVDGTYEVQKISVPEEIKPRLPHSWPGSEGSLLVSYADFVCPDDCPEPDFCTATGERREQPLHDLLRHLDLPGFHVHVIRSHQIAPGLGGYTVADLTGVAGELKKTEMGKWLLGTACKCHGILTAFNIR